MKRAVNDTGDSYVHPLVGNHSWGLPIRVFQLICAALVLALSWYTIEHIDGWKEARLAVATGAWGVVSTLWILSLGMSYRPRNHHHLLHFFEFTNWALFLATWIALVVNISKHDQCVADDGGYSHIRPCNTIYAAIAFAIVNWLLWTFTHFGVASALSTRSAATGPATTTTATTA